MIVDPDEDARRDLRAVLGHAGARVLEAEDGSAALREAIRWQPDLIAFDPSTFGEAAPKIYRSLRRDPRISDIPVCLVTDEPALRPRLCDQGVRTPDGLCLKPLDAGRTVTIMTKVLRIHGRWWSRRVSLNDTAESNAASSLH